jgi:hypothetical protein
MFRAPAMLVGIAYVYVNNRMLPLLMKATYIAEKSHKPLAGYEILFAMIAVVITE